MTAAADLPAATDAAVASAATGLLRTFNRAGVLGLADVHTATRVSALAGETDESMRLALALTVRALRAGSVCVDLTTVHLTSYDDAEQTVDSTGLPWPAPPTWLAACRASPMVAVGPDADSGRPLRMAHGLLYLERYWREEEHVRTSLLARQQHQPPAADLDRLGRGLDRLFDRAGLAADEPDRQRIAAGVSALRWVTVIAGGPGTGKTTTVARLLALLRDRPGPRLRVALTAPTGKAAARLEEAVREAHDLLPPADQQRLGDLSASTLHRLLGWLPARRGRFRHDRDNRLPYDVIVVDEMSMVSLTLMSRLLEAVRADTRLVLVGDPDQLSSVEAGAVLADIAATSQHVDARLAGDLPQLAGSVARDVPVTGLVRLTHTWRFDGAIDRLAQAIRVGDADAAVDVLRSGDPAVDFAEVDLGTPRPDDVADLVADVVRTGRALSEAARGGHINEALDALDAHRLLCGHRRGPYGVTHWAAEAQRWLLEAGVEEVQHGGTDWYPGRPILVLTNDREINLYNGDTGVMVQTDAGLRAAFRRGGSPTLVAPVRLPSVQTVHAMTVHRAQGSQFGRVTLVLPPADSPLLTRELLYTAATRATERVRIFGTEDAVRRAVVRPANRATGLRDRLL